MKMLIEKKILLEGLNAVSKALSLRNIIPVLNGIKFDLTEEGLYLLATDNDITIQYYIDKREIKSIDEEGCTVVYGKTLLDIMRRLPDTDVLIESFENNELSFKTENSVYNFNCYMKEDFPNIDFDKSNDIIKIDASRFKDMISKTAFACSLQESRPLLTGVNIKLTGNIFECIATDSYRLAKVTLTMDNVESNDINIVIPAKNINEFIKIIDNDDEVEMHIFANKVIFRYSNIIFQTSLLNGNYPNTDNSIASEFKYIINVNLKDFYNTLDRASLLTQTKDKNIIDMEIDENNIIIKASSSEMGSVEEKISIQNETANSLKISFSAKYMLEALKMFESEKLIILLNGEISPIILKEKMDSEMIQLILPMKTY